MERGDAWRVESLVLLGLGSSVASTCQPSVHKVFPGIPDSAALAEVEENEKLKHPSKHCSSLTAILLQS